jgi:acetyltransferase-like isoleucine patch superfamily enzyme
MHIVEKIYRSPLGRILSIFASIIAKIHQPFMVYGIVDPATKRYRKFTRLSSSVVILSKPKLAIADHVWVWHHSILDATEGIIIEEGAQIGVWVGIFTHGSEKSIRLLGKQFVNIPNLNRLGYSRGSVKIGAYTFIGAGSVVLPGVSIGKGCLISTGTLVTKDIPDYSIVIGWPGKIQGSTIDFDLKSFKEHDYSGTYYDEAALNLIKEKLININNKI